MRIAIITLTTTARRTGVAEYVINLLDGLQKLDAENEYFVFTGMDNRHMFDIRSPNFSEVRLSLTHASYLRPVFYFWLMFLFPIWARRQKIDVVHLPNTLFVTGFFKTVTTIHDVVELKIKKYSPIRTAFRRLMIKSAILNSRKLITVSHSSARDLIDLGARNVASIHLGFTNPYLSFHPKLSAQQVLEKYLIGENPFVLFIGTLMKHKNVTVLIAAFKVALETNPSLQLVIVGAPDNDHKNILKTIKSHQLNDRVHLLNFITQEEKLLLLHRASVFCFISSYEGFGIPILEAQAAGVPVIANNVSSLPEIGGKGVFLVNPENLKQGTAEALSTLLGDQSLREQMVLDGFENLVRFSWDNLAQRTLDVYKELR